MSRTATGRSLIAAAAAGVTAAGAARLAYAAVRRRPPGGTGTWSRTNHRGEAVTLLEGPAVTAGAIVGVLAQGSIERASWRPALAMVAGAAGAAAFGAYDDLAGSGAGAGSAATSVPCGRARSPPARSSSAASASPGWPAPRWPGGRSRMW